MPPRGTPRSGGTISFGQVTGSTPSYIFPIIPAANATSSTINLIQNLFLPLYNGPKGEAATINDGLSVGQQAGVQRRRQNGHDRDQARLPVV